MYLFVKRGMDILLATLMLIVLSPLMLALMIAVKATSPGPIFFCQKRVGARKRSFTIYKFRTMRVNAPNYRPTHKLETPEAYITPVGRYLRATSLDELPQLLNIIKGDMSLVGPRPALWNQEDLIAARDAVGANDVRPGLTGWAQINGRDELAIPEKARLDGEYVQRMGLRFDLWCILGTVMHLARGEGVVEGVQREDKRD